jgi:hypothetical protein
MLSGGGGKIRAVGKVSGGMSRKDLDRLSRLAYERERIQAAFNEAIVKAVESGETTRDVGAAGRVSHQWVSKVMKAHRESKTQE